MPWVAGMFGMLIPIIMMVSLFTFLGVDSWAQQRRKEREAATPPPIEFPWRRFLVGVGTNVALLVVIFMLLASVSESGSGPTAAADLLSALASPVGLGLAAAAGTIGASVMIVWLALRSTRNGVNSF